MPAIPRISPLPRTEEAADVSSAPAPTQGAPAEPPTAPARTHDARRAPTASTGGAARRYRPIESQMDKAGRDYLDTTAFTIRLRTENGFDRSALLRGIVRGLYESNIDLARECGSEDEIADLIKRRLNGSGG